MFGEDRYHRMDFDYETPEWLEWILGLQKDAWSALYKWFKGLLAVIKIGDAEEIGIYLAQIPLSIYNYIETENIGVNAIVALYVSSLIVLMRMSGILHSMVGLLDVAYKLIAPITPDYLLKYIPLWILRSALYYLVIVLKVVSLVWKETFGAVAQIGSRMALAVSLPWLVVGLSVWNWRLFVCEETEDPTEEGETVDNDPLFEMLPGGDKIVKVTDKLLCWLPFFSTIYNILSTAWQWIKNVGVDTSNAIITAINEVVGIIKTIIGGLAKVCKSSVTKDIVGGENGDFCKGLLSGEADMIAYQKHLNSTKCKLTSFKTGAECGMAKCDKEFEVPGGQISYAECSGGTPDWSKEKTYLPPGVATFSIYNEDHKKWMSIQGGGTKRLDNETLDSEGSEDNDSRVVFRNMKYEIVDQLIQYGEYYVESFRTPSWYLGTNSEPGADNQTTRGIRPGTRETILKWRVVGKGGKIRLQQLNNHKDKAMMLRASKEGSEKWKIVSKGNESYFKVKETGKKWMVIPAGVDPYLAERKSWCSSAVRISSGLNNDQKKAWGEKKCGDIITEEEKGILKRRDQRWCSDVVKISSGLNSDQKRGWEKKGCINIISAAEKRVLDGRKRSWCSSTAKRTSITSDQQKKFKSDGCLNLISGSVKSTYIDRKKRWCEPTKRKPRLNSDQQRMWDASECARLVGRR